MSSNQLVNDSNNTNLKQVRNCVNPDLSKNMNVHYKTRSFEIIKFKNASNII